MQAAKSEAPSSPTGAYDQPAPWRFSARGLAIRLFLTCWLVYSLHAATNTVREIYLALAIADHLSFRVDDYAHIHPDLFEKPGYGWHIGANPGASMFGAIPYALCRPVIDPILNTVNRRRAARLAAGIETPSYNSPWPMAQQFYREAWRRGLDVKFGIAAIVMQALCMAPISALGVIGMFYLLRSVFASDRTAVWLCVLYAFGTPVFFRAGYLNHNMMIGHVAFLGFLALWNPAGTPRWTIATRSFLGGLAGGTALLLDYSGIVFLLGLFGYLLAKAWKDQRSQWFRSAAWYVLGSLAPVLLLCWYQYRSFGNPIYPGQHWMPAVQWIDAGYQGFTVPQPDILKSLAFDYRYGLFTSCPLYMLALASPWFRQVNGSRFVPARELAAMLALVAGLYLFCSGISYTRLQYNTGVRYLAPAFPFLFVCAALALMNLPLRARYFVAVVAIAQAWCMAMYRDVERGFGVLEPVLQVFTNGFQLPALTVLSRMSEFQEYFSRGYSALPLFAVAGAILFGLWSRRLSGLR